ncbi:hypothetical protein A4D02_18585 [Niastella koreensis]|uniref:Uncharacterized protein n=2 Tax=Niastella koreensis TaxID=354356 RepID=G8T925_NIAKG|nr:AAA domain-containing protein [Niastella koreensis]AEV96978.1 hypothetical protein Niako_0584 [Niastella koreensis GR20-10]OQP39326.1 hypothetical protein A4D02_18585 [Niastella koreensis]
MSGKTHYTNVLKFWRAIEIFDLPDLPVQKQNDQKIFTELLPGDDLPWENGEFHNSDGKQWKHTLYFFCTPKQSVIDLLTQLSPFTSDLTPEPLINNTCLAALVLDSNGLPSERTYVRASFAFGLKILKDGGNFEKLSDLLNKAQSDYLLRFQVKAMQENDLNSEEDIYEEDNEDNYYDDDDCHEEEISNNSMISWIELEKELNDLEQLVNEQLPMELPILCVSEEVSEQTTLEAPFLNSFYRDDLNHLIGNPKNLGAPLSTYLTRNIDTNQRFNLLNKVLMFECINPKFQTPGRWPSNPEYGLYSAQQAALHYSIPILQNQDGLIGINGPPGTGKTTLLREIIVDVIVSRAKKLLSTNIHNLFSAKRIEVAEYIGYYEPDPFVFGNNGILVASNNNTAVENISKELPLLKNIDADIFSDADYFSQIAQNLNPRETCWGLLSSVLGNSKNRGNFINAFWFNKGNGFNAYLKDQKDLPTHKKHIEHYEQVADELKIMLGEYEEFKALASEYHNTLQNLIFENKNAQKLVKKYEKLSVVLKEKYNIPTANLPNRLFSYLSMEDIHKLTPYSSEKINKLRSNIFLKSLELHESVINVNARFFNSNLNAFVNMLQGNQTALITEDIAAILWNTFFFCIPLISTTLASIQRLFNKTRKGGIGWLLLDEAGQATPQSACGAIWRSKRCIIIGDTLQIPPIVTIPEGLEKMLQEKYKIDDNCWLPSSHSAQFLADRVTPIGTYVQTNDKEVWTGIPLRAHRRCNEPMFTISNRIAYNEQMVKVVPDVQTNILKSCWVDVQGVLLETGNVLREEIDMLKTMVGEFSNAGHGKGIYVISPFRSVADYCKDEFNTKIYKGNIECGTIHTFQGKESDIVFLVLGSHPKNNGARQWASAIPNMLNVAVTRAKKRLYVIGNRQLWSSCNYYDLLAKMIPTIKYDEHKLFK